MSLIPHYDPADDKLLNFVSEAVAQEYLAGGIAHAVRTKSGRIMRLYRRVRERAYGSARDGIGTANRTTQRIYDASGVLIAPPLHREHKNAVCLGWNPAHFGWNGPNIPEGEIENDPPSESEPTMRAVQRISRRRPTLTTGGLPLRPPLAVAK